MNVDQPQPRRRITDSADVPIVLVVDDSRAMRTILSRILEDAGYTVSQAENGREALEFCGRNQPDLVLLDVDMPVMDGIETLKAMRADPELATVAVLFLTARTGSEDVVAGLSLGARDYVRKPCEPAELIARVSTTMRLRAQERELLQRARDLDDLSTTDPLTGLGNRRRLDARLRQLSEQYGPQASIGVALADLDLFKTVNDSYGHAVGDSVLRIVARRLIAAAGPSATVVRWGGEEFLVVVPEAVATDLAAVGERLRSAIDETPLTVGLDEGLSVTISIGCGAGTLGSYERTVEAADGALYEAKRLGRNRVVVHE